MTKTRHALRLARASWTVVRSDPWLLAVPALSAISILFVIAICFVPAVVLTVSDHSQVFVLAAVLIATYPLTLIGVFFRFAFVIVVSERMDDRHLSIGQGLAKAWRGRDAIVRWSLIATCAALLFRALRQIPLLGGVAGSIASALLGIAWGAVTFFVVPVIALEDVRGRRALDRSAELFRERWGLEVLGVASITGIFVLGTIVGAFVMTIAIAAVHTSTVAVIVLVLVSVLGLITAILAATAVQQTFGVALYRYATGRPLPPSFSATDLQAAVRPKRLRGWLGG